MPRCAENDIVRIRDNGACYIITHRIKFGDTEETGYKLLKVYPASDEIEFVTVAEREVSIIAREGKYEYKIIMSFLNEEYRRIGFPSFLHFFKKAMSTQYINTKIKAKNRGIGKRKNSTRAKNNNNSFPQQMLDAIYYNEIETVDECLDALNDLNVLHEMFGDEAYQQLKELVLKRLEELSKKKG